MLREIEPHKPIGHQPKLPFYESLVSIFSSLSALYYTPAFTNDLHTSSLPFKILLVLSSVDIHCRSGIEFMTTHIDTYAHTHTHTHTHTHKHTHNISPAQHY